MIGNLQEFQVVEVKPSATSPLTKQLPFMPCKSQLSSTQNFTKISFYFISYNLYGEHWNFRKDSHGGNAGLCYPVPLS